MQSYLICVRWLLPRRNFWPRISMVVPTNEYLATDFTDAHGLDQPFLLNPCTMVVATEGFLATDFTDAHGLAYNGCARE